VYIAVGLLITSLTRRLGEWELSSLLWEDSEEAAAKFVARIAVAFAVAVIIASMKET